MITLLPHTHTVMESGGRDGVKGAVLHIVVVGFHHKRGCQVTLMLTLAKHRRAI